jgi:CRISPR system Cascade subunit CasC
VKVTAKEGDETEYLLFLGRREIDALADLIERHWDALSAGPAPAETPTAEANDKKKAKTAKQRKSEAKEAVPAEVVKQVEKVLDGGKAADLALFGRMLADRASLNVDAACQVAHALSTNKVSMEMDFFTAVDDLKTREEDVGAGMLGTVEFNSSCFYRYANVHYGQLLKNLQGDAGLARKTVEAFLRASVEAIPTGKQNSMAAHNPPSLVFAVVRERGLWSLANAFVQPVRPDREGSLVQKSVAALDRYWGKLTGVFGGDGIRAAAVCSTEDVPFDALKGYAVGTFPGVVRKVLDALPAGKEVS